MKMEKTECSETSAYKIQTAGNYPEESIQYYTKFVCLVKVETPGFLIFRFTELAAPKHCMNLVSHCNIR
jgi:hypothetical protein